ncbi:MAG: NAD(P)-dependent oxidoreductase [Acidobacteria bacterium]|nr:MAG: NAD(P)-dependent oxidoreductase [Acidobacteriota bacterium]
MPILVAGSTGFVGGEIVRGLQQHNQKVRALVRGGASNPKAQGLREIGTEIVDGDLTRPETLNKACQGAEIVITTVTSMPAATNDGLRRVDRDGTLALIAAAERAGAKKFIYTSYSGNLRIDSPLETAKRDCENELVKSRMQAVILRPTYFMESWLSPALGFDPINGAVRIYGSGDAKVSYISGFNVADAAVAAAIHELTDKDTILEMGGPETLSQLDVVHIFEQAVNQKIRLDFVPVEALQQQHRSSDPLQKTFAALTLGYARGDIVKGAQATAQKYAVKLRSVEQYASGFRMRQAGNVA